MSEPMRAELVLWQQLGKYLKTETEVRAPEVIQDPRYGAKRPIEVTRLKIRFSNIAPDDPGLPNIVFTGVGLSIVPLPDLLDSESIRAPRWERYDTKMEKPARARRSHAEVGPLGGHFPKAKPWTEITPDEAEHGIALFPGDSATLELTVPTADLRKYELHVEGSVSRRHFFHYDQVLKLI